MRLHVLFALCFLALATVSNTNSFGLVFARAAEGMGLEVAALGGLRTIENLASIVAALIVAPLVDRFPRKRLLLSGFAMTTLAVLLLVVLNSVWGTIIFFVLNGAGMVQVFGAIMAIPSDFVNGRQLNRVMGLVIGCIAFTSVLVAPVVGNVADAYGWRSGMLVSLSVSSMALILALTLIPSYPVVTPSGSAIGFIGRYRAVLSNIPLLLILASNMLRFSLLAAILTFLSTVLIRRYDLSLSLIGGVFAIYGITFFCASLLTGVLLHWLKTRRILILGGSIVAVLFAFMFVHEPSLGLMILAIVATILIIAAQENTGTIAALRLAGGLRGAAMSWNELAVGLGAFIGIGCGSIGLALGGISGLGVALFMIAVIATVVSYIALRYAGDEADAVDWDPSGSAERAPGGLSQ